MNNNIGFISFRFAGTDGVSLEMWKWARILERIGFRCHYMAGELETPAERSYVSEKSHFKHPEIRDIYHKAFHEDTRAPDLTSRIHRCKEELKSDIYAFIDRHDIGLIIAENSLTIPLNIPLGIAITDVVAETGIMTIAHHHDFFWERKRFLRNCVWDYLNACCPPHLPTIKHVVINTSARNQLALRTGIGATLIPNVMEFEKPPPGIDDYNCDVRETLGIGDDQLLLLQPTRVVQRKGIEHAIEFAARLERDCVLVISHAVDDEGYEYQQRVMQYADLLNVKALFMKKIIATGRGRTAAGEKIYAIDDVYPHADLVTYPSVFEGFGNAFLEAVYFKKPIVVNNYSIYSHDIKPKGFEVIEMDDGVSSQTLEHAERILDDPAARENMVEHNYKLAMEYYSYGVLELELKHIMTTFLGVRAQ